MRYSKGECILLTGLRKLGILNGGGQNNISHLSSRLRGMTRITQTEEPRAGDDIRQVSVDKEKSENKPPLKTDASQGGNWGGLPTPCENLHNISNDMPCSRISRARDESVAPRSYGSKTARKKWRTVICDGVSWIKPWKTYYAGGLLLSPYAPQGTQEN